jgi:peptide/nickel transport system permease protein
MAGFIVKRTVFLLPIIFGVTLITFLISRVIVPNPARAWAGPHATPEAVASLAARYHLTGPIYLQYIYYLFDLMTGNWGQSPTTGRPILYEVSIFFPPTLELALLAILLTIIIGIPLGVAAAIFHDRNVDHSIRLFYLTGFSSPPFFIALILLLTLGYYAKVFPTVGQLSMNLTPPTPITGMYIIDSLLTGNWTDLMDSLWHAIMPATTLALTYFGLVTRVTRASMLEVFEKDFIRASYAKGLSDATVMFKHALRNALIPTTTVLGLVLGALLSGTIVIESIFLWPGIGLYAFQAISDYDFPAIMAITLLFTLGVVLANLAADIIYAFINPRIRL